MKKDYPERGAVLQRDRETYAIAPHIPGGITDVPTLRKIADVAEKYQAQALKLTSAQRIAIVGIPEEQIDAAWRDVGEEPGNVIGMCVRSVKICPGTTYCKRGQQNSVEVGLTMDERYHGLELPWKFKMGISGCVNDCAEGCVKDIALVGTPKGWNVMVGGNGGAQPRLSHKLLQHVPSDDEALAIVDRIVTWFREQNRRCRLGKFVEEMGIEAFREEVLAGMEVEAFVA